MIGMQVKTVDTTKAVTAAMEKAKYKTFRHAAFSIRKDAASTIRQRKNKRLASPAGSPPFQHTPGFLRKAIWTAADQYGAVIGFRKSVIGMVAATHEHGLIEEGRQYPKRPTMQPALERNLGRFHRDWRSSL